MSKLMGGIIMGVGLLIAGVSGICSVAVLWDGFSHRGQTGGEYLDFSAAVPLIGGVPFLVGLGLFFWGRTIVRRAEKANKESHLDDLP